MSVLDDIRAARDLQDQQWGGQEHDDKEGYRDWLSYVIKQLGAAQVVGERLKSDGWLPASPKAVSIGLLKDQRYRLIKAAALLVAQVEALDRKIASYSE